jgi:hypothetical protein
MLNKPTAISQDFEYILDFDAMASIQYDQQNDQYKLIPVLRAFERGSEVHFAEQYCKKMFSHM